MTKSHIDLKFLEITIKQSSFRSFYFWKWMPPWLDRLGILKADTQFEA